MNYQLGCPTFAGDLADACYAAERAEKAPGGVYNYAGVAIWPDFAEAIFWRIRPVRPAVRTAQTNHDGGISDPRKASRQFSAGLFDLCRNLPAGPATLA